MIDNRTGNKIAGRYPSAVFLTAAGGLGYWLGQSQGDRLQLISAAIVLVITFLIALVWQARSRAAEQWHTVWNAYAEREIALASLQQSRLRTR